MRTKNVTYFDSEGNEHQADLPAAMVICYACDGEGKTSEHLGSFTSSEWAEEDDDFKEDYLAGRYDRACSHCKGSGRLVELCRERELLTPAQRHVLDCVEAQEREVAEVASIEAAERRMGA